MLVGFETHDQHIFDLKVLLFNATNNLLQTCLIYIRPSFLHIIMYIIIFSIIELIDSVRIGMRKILHRSNALQTLEYLTLGTRFFKRHHCVLQLISNRMSAQFTYAPREVKNGDLAFSFLLFRILQ